MGQKPSRGDVIGPLDWFRRLPFAHTASSYSLGWRGLEAARKRLAPASEINAPPLTYHRLVLFTRPPEECDLVYDGVKRHVPPPAGSIMLVPAGSAAQWRWKSTYDSLHIFLEAALVARVADETFGLDPSRLTLMPLDALELPNLRTTILAVDAELAAGGGGGRLAAESLANLVAVHLIRHVLGTARPERGRSSSLSRVALRAVFEYIEEHVSADLTLEQMAATAHLSAFHFARQFKAATGMPPHQYIITRRIERAQHLLHASEDLSLSEIATRTGFADQSHFSNHFKRIVGLTPRQFRIAARSS